MKIVLLISFLGISCQNLQSQNGFDSYLQKDSIYRFTSSIKQIDSLISIQFDQNRKDTSFYNSFGKAEVINLNQLLYLTVNNNPELIAIQSNIDATKILSKEKGYLPDPMLEVETDNVMSNFKKVGMINFYASQMFPFPGKLKLEQQRVLNSKNMLESEKITIAVEKINMVKQNYYDLFFNNKKLQINANNQLLVKTFITAAESRYSVGKGMQQEVFKAQIEMSRLTNEEFVLKQQRKSIYSELTKLSKTVIDGNTHVNFADIDLEYLLGEDNYSITEEQANKLVDYAFKHRADLKTIQNKIVMNKTELEIAKLSRMPDFNIKAGYKILPFEEKNAFQFTVGINIPIAPWSSGKYDYSIQRNEINVKTGTLEFETRENAIRNEIINIVNNIRSAKGTMSYYYGVLIPQTENTLKSTQYSYENNMTTFLDLLDSYKMYQEANLMYYESVNMYLKMIADLEMTAGLNLK